MKHLICLLSLVSASAFAQSVTLNGAAIELPANLQLRASATASANDLARVGKISIQKNAGAAQAPLSLGRSTYLGAGFDPATKVYGLVSNEVSFKLRPGHTIEAVRLSTGAASPPRLLVPGSNLYLIEVSSLSELQRSLQQLRSHPAVEWADGRFVTELRKPQ